MQPDPSSASQALEASWTEQSQGGSSGRTGSESELTYDGILCLGGVDWWYHNRGHYDLRLMEQFSRELPVLYVNSIGVRRPSVGEGRVFLCRIGRKLKSIRRGLVRVRENFHVFSPLTGPYFRDSAVHRWALRAQVQRAARRSGMRRPLIWVACPAAAELALDLQEALGSDLPILHQRTDRFEAFDKQAKSQVLDQVAQLAKQAELTLYCSRELMANDTDVHGERLFVDHGVDAPSLQAAALQTPEDCRDLPQPRVGFVGGIDAHTFDLELFEQVAQQIPEAHFVLVGGCTLDVERLTQPNVTLLGKRPLEEVGAYMGACDVLIMPWNDNDWIRACNPVKLKEYLAVGKPIVSTPFAELEHYQGLVHASRGVDAFVRSIRISLNTAHDPQPGLDRLQRESWSDKAQQIRAKLGELGWQTETVPSESRRATTHRSRGMTLTRRLALALGLTSALGCRALPDAPDYDVSVAAAQAPPSLDSTLLAGDRFQIRFPAYPQWNEVLLVQPDGQASLPLLGLRQVAGRELAELEAELAEDLENRVRSPRIELAVIERHPRQVFVGGEVDYPGLVDIHGPSLTLMQAVFARGGPVTAKAAVESVVLSRVDESGERVSWTVNGRELLDGRAAPVWLHPGDVIWVPNRRIDEANLFVQQYLTNMVPGGNLLSAVVLNQVAVQ